MHAPGKGHVGVQARTHLSANEHAKAGCQSTGKVRECPVSRLGLQMEADLARRLSVLALSCGVMVLLAYPALAWQTDKRSAAQKDSSYIDADGTAHITRVIPLPTTVSP